MPSLVCHHLSFSWPSGEVVLSDLSVAFPAARTGLIGSNGVGKSTLLRLLAGELSPTAGYVSGVDSVGYLPQHLTLDAGRTVGSVLGIDEIVAALHRIDSGSGEPADFDLVGDRWDIEERAAAALADFGLAGAEPGRRISTLSGGEVILLALASLFLAAPDVLLLDEPTNNLDGGARSLLYQAVERWRGPVIMVSHDRELLERIDYIAEMRDGAIRLFGGQFTAFTEALAVEQEADARSVRAAQGDLQRQQRELAQARVKLDRRQRYARSQASNVPKIVAGAKQRAAQVSAGKLRGGHQAEVVLAQRQLDAAEERLRDENLMSIDLTSTTVPRMRDVVVATDLVLRNGVSLSLHIRGPERIGLVGDNGSGKTTLIQTLTGEVLARAGSVAVRVPYRVLPQRLQLLRDDETVVAGVARYAPSAEHNTLRAQLARFLLDAATVARLGGTLSGGERFRASLAALLLAEPPPQLLIFDEPTNNLDLDSVGQLTAALSAYRGALLIVSHDEQLLTDLNLDRRLEMGQAGRW